MSAVKGLSATDYKASIQRHECFICGVARQKVAPDATGLSAAGSQVLRCKWCYFFSYQIVTCRPTILKKQNHSEKKRLRCEKQICLKKLVKRKKRQQAAFLLPEKLGAGGNNCGGKTTTRTTQCGEIDKKNSFSNKIGNISKTRALQWGL